MHAEDGLMPRPLTFPAEGTYASIAGTWWRVGALAHEQGFTGDGRIES